MGRRKSKTSATSDHDRVLKFLTERKGEEYHTKIVADYIKKIYHDERTLKQVYDSVRQALARHNKCGKVQKVKKGKDVFWSIPTKENIVEQVDEVEQQLSKLIEMQPSQPPQFHNIQFHITKANCDKSKGNLSERIKTMFNTLDTLSIYQCFASRATTQIKGGVQEKFTFKGNSVTIQCYGTGSVNITINASQNPLSFEDVLLFETWLDALLQSISRYSFTELMDITSVCWEWNNDKEQTERIDASGKYAITVRQFDDMVSRVYLKHFKDGTIKERTEQAITKPISYPDWLTQSSVMFAGGVNSQFLIRNQFEHEKVVEQQNKTIELLSNAILLNQNLLQRQGMDTAHLQACMEKLAKDMGVDLPNKENTLRKKKEE